MTSFARRDPVATLARLALLVLGLALAAPLPARAASAEQIDAKVDLAYAQLLADSPTAQALDQRAVAVLIFPDIVKGGFGIGGQFGQGALRQAGATVGYYSIASASFGFQIGAQAYGQAIFFMTPQALDYLERSGGFEIGADANLAVATVGVGADVSSTTLQDPIVAVVFGQKGLMAGVTVEGSKITRITPR